MPYGIIIKFTGSQFAGKEQRLVSVTPAQNSTISILSRGGGSVIEDSTTPPSGTGLAMNIVKAGAGTLTLAGNNTFRGTTTVNQGVLKITTSNALGQPTGSTIGNTVVAVGELDVAANVNIGDEALTLSGTGYIGNQFGSGNNVGALHVLGGPAIRAGAAVRRD